MANITVLICLSLFFVTVKLDCLLDVATDVNANHDPLILKPGRAEFILPTKEGIKLKTNGRVQLVCNGKENSIQVNERNVYKEELIVQCHQGTTFSWNNNRYKFKDFTCLKNVAPTARIVGRYNRSPYGDTYKIQIGYNVSTGFISTVKVLFSNSKKDAVYSHYELLSSVDKQSSHNVQNPSWRKDFYDTVKMDKLYTITEQLNTFSNLLGDENLAKRYISRNEEKFLAKGHLSTKRHFTYGFQQRSTLFYMNAAPQWQEINNGEWKSLENSIKKYAYDKNVTLSIYTGTWDTATLPGKHNQQTPLYLNVDSSGNKVSVPKWFWKIAYDAKSRRGIAFVSYNNISPQKSHIALCQDICNRASWMNLDRKSTSCCEVNDLKRTVSSIPNFQVKGTLL